MVIHNNEVTSIQCLDVESTLNRHCFNVICLLGLCKFKVTDTRSTSLKPSCALMGSICVPHRLYFDRFTAPENMSIPLNPFMPIEFFYLKKR